MRLRIFVIVILTLLLVLGCQIPLNLTGTFDITELVLNSDNSIGVDGSGTLVTSSDGNFTIEADFDQTIPSMEEVSLKVVGKSDFLIAGTSGTGTVTSFKLDGDEQIGSSASCQIVFTETSMTINNAGALSQLELSLSKR